MDLQSHGKHTKQGPGKFWETTWDVLYEPRHLLLQHSPEWVDIMVLASWVNPEYRTNGVVVLCHFWREHVCLIHKKASYVSVQQFLVTAFPSVLWHSSFSRKEQEPSVKSWVLVCWWWQFDCSFARVISPAVTTTSIVLSSNKTG